MEWLRKFLRRINPSFFLIAFIFPAGVVALGFLLLLLLVALPYFNLKVSTVMESPVVPSGFKEVSGFSKFQYSELKIGDRDVAVVKNLPATFRISIPKLHIENAKVETNSTNLDPINLLGHYKGTSLPGEPGNVFIYGHSVLSIFFNPKDYKTIFSTLPRLEKGDKVFIDYASKSYTYEVVEKLTLKPKDVNVLDTNPGRLPLGSKTLTLMTCVPPGARTFRLLVVAKEI